MNVRILELNNGHVSLEFGEKDVSLVAMTATKLFGEVSHKPYIMAAEVYFGGAKFTYQDEWNDPCLISNTDLGDACLRRVYEEMK